MLVKTFFNFYFSRKDQSCSINSEFMFTKNFNTVVLFAILIVSIAAGCNSKEKNFNSDRQIYQAIHNKDTAILSISINKDRFHGQYEIKYYKIGKDSGNVRGTVWGDTLRGDFHYYSYGGGMKRVPLAFLHKQNKLFLGTGVIGTIYNLPCYVPEVPIDYSNPHFVFEPLAPSKNK
jgi:hypothetical protein